MEHTEKVELSRTVVSKLSAGIYDWHNYQRDREAAVWSLCNSLAHSLAGGKIEFLTGHVHSLDTGEIEIAAYTAHFLVYWRGVPGPDGPVYRILPRRSLSVLEVHSAPMVLPAPSMHYNSTGSYGVEYGDSLRFSLPLASRERDYDGLDAFAPSLWKDLAAE